MTKPLQILFCTSAISHLIAHVFCSTSAFDYLTAADSLAFHVSATFFFFFIASK
jgi:hypothetical protein